MTSFAVTWDYRCPFARNAHEHVLTGLDAGADWDVTFVPFSLGQVHVEEGQLPIWERPDEDSGLLALQVGTVVRDAYPDAFRQVHDALFALRHDEGRDIRDEALLRKVLTDHDVDADAVFAAITSGEALETVRGEHSDVEKSHDVWGVPTFIVGDRAAFIRFMHRPEGDLELGRRTVDRVVDMLETFPEMNEFKHTTLSR
jgi:DSBA-like thioredoxin domain